MTRGTGEASHSEASRPRTRRSGRTPRSRRIRAYIGLGSNVGEPEGTLAAAVATLAALPGAGLRAVSPLYATAPVGVTDQPEFRNAVVALDVPAGPEPATGALALLVALKAIERSFGRRERERWGPRELDLDLLLFGRWSGSAVRPADARSDDPAKRDLPLTVPHPEARRRLFVLAPLADLAPRLVPPGWGETVARAAARQRAIEGEDAVRRLGDWTGTGWTIAAGPIAAPDARPA
ncbi:MAG TPA: 2-amino-4-hydroxy-6-hydroxymethyldihydropteridine diphosphokinase [Candidatus Limnocylindrales bacterium]|nr:2-amino-4-hydroxy-6-hydroxymethyldihydropteridine diphosphokinase [Candidatus Limnocylindrales bacterium]